jgi:hypothetical protein
MTEIAPTDEPQSPGSLRSFAEAKGLDTSSTEARFLHADALDGFRRQLAEFRGITLDQLHGIGKLVIQQVE